VFSVNFSTIGSIFNTLVVTTNQIQKYLADNMAIEILVKMLINGPPKEILAEKSDKWLRKEQT
jgi:hypothetical protein